MYLLQTLEKLITIKTRIYFLSKNIIKLIEETTLYNKQIEFVLINLL